jgi:hypothetical protein
MDQDYLEIRRQQALADIDARIKEIGEAIEPSVLERIMEFFRKLFGREVRSSTVCVEAWNLHGLCQQPPTTYPEVRYHCSEYDDVC